MDSWIEEARAVSTFEAFGKLRNQPKLRKTSEGFAGPCPSCGDDGRPATSDRFGINAREGTWLCRKCGKKGGDGIQLIMEMDGEPFLSAVEILAGRPRPDGKEQQSRAVDEDALRERAEERRVQNAVADAAEREKKQTQRERANAFFQKLEPFKGSLADEYLKRRKIRLTAEMATDLRFAPHLEYKGFPDRDASAEVPLGEFPAMVAAIRNVKNEIIGVHRTYIDPETGLKLKPPGDSFRNAAKKVWGGQAGGFILLGPLMAEMAVGEGIETTASWYQLGIGPDEIGLMVGVNLGNIAGKSTGSVKHPKKAGSTIPNGVPLPLEEQTGMALPPAVKHVILLIDGDSEAYSTTAKILNAGRRFRDHYGVKVSTCHPGIKGDFNDILMGSD